MSRRGLLLVFFLFTLPCAVARGGMQATYAATVGTPNGLTRVELLDTKGQPVRVLDSFDALNGNWEASWSPDKRWLAWIDPDGLNLANADGTNARLIAHSTGTMRYAWSPDSRSLAISDGPRLFTITNAGSQHAALIPRGSSTTFYWVFGWTRTGVLATRLKGETGTASCCSYSVMSAQAHRSPRMVYGYPDWHCNCSRPSLSPDGRRFAYFDDGITHVVSIATGTSRVKGTTRHRIAGPFWSPTWTPTPLPRVPRGVQLLSLAHL